MEQAEAALASEVLLDDLQIDPALMHLADAGGKRLRPLLVLLCSELGPNPDAAGVMDAAIGISKEAQEKDLAGQHAIFFLFKSDTKEKSLCTLLDFVFTFAPINE